MGDDGKSTCWFFKMRVRSTEEGPSPGCVNFGNGMRGGFVSGAGGAVVWQLCTTVCLKPESLLLLLLPLLPTGLPSKPLFLF